jgi:hypothetical protein
MEKGIVPQVGHLQELYRDARSTEHKKKYKCSTLKYVLHRPDWND